MTAVDVDALDKLREAATPGEWEHITDYHQRGIVDESIWAGTAPDNGYYISERVSSDADAALIVAAVNALPELLAEVRRGRALREALTKLIAVAPVMWHGTYPVIAVPVSDLLSVLTASPPQTSPATSADEQEIPESQGESQ